MPRQNQSVDMSHFGVVDQAVNVMKQVESYISVGMEMTLDVASDVVVGEDNEDCDGGCEGTLKEVMLDYIRMERDFKQFIQSMQYVKEQVVQGADSRNLEEILNRRVKELAAHNDDSVFPQHERYKDLIEKIEINNTETETESALSHTGVTMATEDEDIEMTQKNVVTKCPYTGQEMRFPVRNKICGHNYEKEGIMEYISKRKHKARCPVGGCHNDQVVKAENLEDNHELQQYIDRKKRLAGKKSKGR